MFVVVVDAPDANPVLFLRSKIKVWDLQAALDPRAPASTLCLRTLVVSLVRIVKNRFFRPFLSLF